MRRTVIALTFVMLAAIAGWLAFEYRDIVPVLADTVASRPVLCWAICLIVYATATLLAMPTWPLTIGSGYLFGVAAGLALVSLGGLTGSVGAFLVGRYIGRAVVRRRIEAMPRFRALDRAVEERGFTVALLSRLSMILPFNVLNFAFGVTAIPVRDYVAATWLGMLPVISLYVFIGAGARNLDALLGETAAAGAFGPWVLAFATCTLAGVVIVVGRTAGRYLDETAGTTDR